MELIGVCMTCRVKEGLNRSEQLVRYFYSLPLLAWPTIWLSLDWHLFSTNQRTLPHLSASAHVGAANTLTLLIKVLATVTVYKGHHRTLFFLPGIISLFIVCVVIIRNNSLAGRCTQAEV